MINREDIKEGLKFSLPNNKIERKHKGATDMCEFIQYLTTLKTPRGDKNYVTLQVPLFEVCGGPKLISSADNTTRIAHGSASTSRYAAMRSGRNRSTYPWTT